MLSIEELCNAYTKLDTIVTIRHAIANSADNKLMVFFSFFFQKTGSDISCKLSPYYQTGWEKASLTLQLYGQIQQTTN